MSDFPNTRDWDKLDEFNDRAVTEAPVSRTHWDCDDTQVDAVPRKRRASMPTTPLTLAEAHRIYALGDAASCALGVQQYTLAVISELIKHEHCLTINASRVGDDCPAMGAAASQITEIIDALREVEGTLGAARRNSLTLREQLNSQQQAREADSGS